MQKNFYLDFLLPKRVSRFLIVYKNMQHRCLQFREVVSCNITVQLWNEVVDPDNLPWRVQLISSSTSAILHPCWFERLFAFFFANFPGLMVFFMGWVNILNILSFSSNLRLREKEKDFLAKRSEISNNEVIKMNSIATFAPMDKTVCYSRSWPRVPKSY